MSAIANDAGSKILAPLETSRFGPAQARHLLRRAGLGGSPGQIDALVGMGISAAVDLLVDYHQVDSADLPAAQADPDIIRPLDADELRQRMEARRTGDAAVLERLQMDRLRRLRDDRFQHAQLQQVWIERMIASPRPLEERMTLMWHNHFAANHRTVRDSFAMLQQQELFRRHAVGDFAALAHGVVRDPAMLRFLDNGRNIRRQPNENLARELMELFLLGEGQYDENDVREAARALTGYSVQDDDFLFRRLAHDPGAKTILGRTDRFDGDSLVDLLLQQDACPAWIARRLVSEFVMELADSPGAWEASASPPWIQAIAGLMREHRYQLGPVLRTVLRSAAFYSPDLIGRRIKSPVELIVGTARTLRTPVRDPRRLVDLLRAMGQDLFDPPSVAGWPGGASWINTSTLFVRQNAAAYLITGRLASGGAWTTDDIAYDPSFLIADLPRATPETIAQRLLETLLAGAIAPARRRQVVEFLRARSQPTAQPSLIGALLLITALPEYQLV